MHDSARAQLLKTIKRLRKEQYAQLQQQQLPKKKSSNETANIPKEEIEKDKEKEKEKEEEEEEEEEKEEKKEEEEAAEEENVLASTTSPMEYCKQLLHSPPAASKDKQETMEGNDKGENDEEDNTAHSSSSY